MKAMQLKKKFLDFYVPVEYLLVMVFPRYSFQKKKLRCLKFEEIETGSQGKQKMAIWVCLFIYLFLTVLGIERRALYLLGKYSATFPVLLVFSL
jgi:hypothetical protein